MAVKDGLPATDFSRMNREYIQAVAEEAGGGLPAVTADDNGKILGVVNGQWGAMDAPGGGSSDFSEISVTVINQSTEFAGNFRCPSYTDEEDYIYSVCSGKTAFQNETTVFSQIIAYKGKAQIELRNSDDFGNGENTFTVEDGDTITLVPIT